MSANSPIGIESPSGGNLLPVMGLANLEPPPLSGVFSSQGDKSVLVLRKRRPNPRKPHCCTFAACTKSYVNLPNLQKHQRHHPKPFTCRYMPCQDAFVSAGDRTKHEVLLHGRSTRLVCYLCTGYSTDKESYIRAHILRMHESVAIGDAMVRIIDGVGPSNVEVPETQILQEAKDPLHTKRDALKLTCYMCSFSSPKKVNMYQHVWRKHRKEVFSLKEAMARILKGKTASSGGEEV